jgi:RNA polymerase sigma-70 factor, ECF subfamily
MPTINAKLPDIDLIAAFKRGNRLAGEELINRHYERILHFCSQRLRSPHDAKDVAQTVFFRVIVEKKIFEFRGQAALSTWLIRIAINACNSHFSRNQRRQSKLSPAGQIGCWEETIPCSRPTPEECFARDERTAELHLVLCQLPAKYRQALSFTYLENRTYREAARRLGIPITVLGVQILRGKKMLGALLAANRRGNNGAFEGRRATLATAASEA